MITRKRKNLSTSKSNAIKISKRSRSTNNDGVKVEINDFNDKFEIIKLTELDNGGKDSLQDDESDDDGQWDDVSELSQESEFSDLVLNMKEVVPGDQPKDKKQKMISIDKLNKDLIKRTMILSLFARVQFINKICCNNIIYNLALSRFPKQFVNINCKNITLDKLLEILCAIKSSFTISNDYSEDGLVREKIVKGLEQGKTSMTWINLILLVMMRSVGFQCRLVCALYPEKGSECKILCEPTTYRASTRGNKKETRNKKKEPIRIPSEKSSFIISTIEVLDEVHCRWVPMDIRNVSTFNDVSAIVKDYPRFLYVIAADNNGYVKDVAAVYDSHWAESSRRLRLGRLSWERIIFPFMSSTVADIDRVEEEVIKTLILSRGVPRTMADLKGHPLLVWKKHLLKYEVVHPPDVRPFGEFNGEHVYLRDNVKTAHTRETWLKEALVVKDGEIPCKRVKTMMSRRKEKTHGTDPSVDIFGPWQVEEYIPPKAVNGIVPINSHGNVDLFQPRMVPDGCVHIRMKGVDKVARQLNISCAAAMVGFGFVKGNRAVPVLDGWVVCKENVKVLSDALREWHRIEALKRAEVRQKIAIKRWETLTRRILIKERLRREYNF